MIRISHSRIERYDACPYSYFMTYHSEGAKKDEYGYSPNDPDPLKIGSFFHNVIDLYSKLLRARRLTCDEEALRIVAEQEWEKEHYIKESFKQEIFDVLIHQFGPSFKIGIEENPLDDTFLESEYQICLDWDFKKVPWDSDSAWFKAKLDRVDKFRRSRGTPPTHCTITDYKSHYMMPTDAEIQKSFQARLYAWAMHILDPYLTNITVAFHFIRLGAIRTVDFEVLDLIGVGDGLKAWTDKLRIKLDTSNSTWPAMRGKACGICNVPCPLENTAEAPIRTFEQAVETANSLQALDMKQKRMQAHLKDFIATNGAVKIATGEYRAEVRPTISIKASEMAQYLLDQGISLDAYLSVKTEEIKKADEEFRADVLKGTNAKISAHQWFGFVKNKTEKKGRKKSDAQGDEGASE